VTPAGRSHAVLELDFSHLLTEENRRDTFLRFFYRGDSGEQSGTVLFVLPREFRFEEPELSWELGEEEDAFLLRVRAEKFTRCLGFTTREGSCVFPDNYFDLSPGEQRLLRISREDCTGIGSAEQLAEVLEANTLNQVMIRAKEA